MILKIALIVMAVLYLLVGLYLFVETIRQIGGMRAAGYENVFIFVLGAITTVISWPIFIMIGLHKINEEDEEDKEW